MRGNHSERFALQGRLEGADPKDSELFRTLLSEAMRVLALDVSDVAAEFGVSLPMVRRWMGGNAVPMTRMRGTVYSWLLDRTLGLKDG